VHAHQYTPLFYSALGRMQGRAHYRLIFTEHGRHYPDHVSVLRRNVNRFLIAKYVDAINACCKFSADALIANEGFLCRPVDVIENGIDYARYQSVTSKQSLRQKLGLNPDKRYITCVARFHPIKDHSTLIKSFAITSKEIADVDLLLVGDGELRNEAVRLCAEHNLQDRVHFLGIRSDVADILQASDLFTLTSLCEAASLTILEAMATGLPVVVTNVGGNPEMVRDGMEGLLVPRQDPQSLAGAFNKVLNHPELAKNMGQAGKNRVLQQYSLSRTIDRYHQLYRELAADRQQD
jgi:glycosyltransferase involved in cell wall biosynthesis